MFEVKELSASTCTAADAAKTIDCEVEEIAKLIVFRTKNGNFPVLVVASGINRISEFRIAEVIGELIERPDADYMPRDHRFCDRGRPARWALTATPDSDR